MASVLVLGVMISLLTMVLLVRLMLVLVARAWLHESLVLAAIHQDMLTLLMAWVVHRIRIVGRSLGYRRARGRRGIIGVATPATVHWGAGSGKMTRVVVLLIKLVVIKLPGSREPVCSICHLKADRKRDDKVYVLFRVAMGVFRSATEEVALRDSLRSTIGIGWSFVCSDPAEVDQSPVCGLRTLCYREETCAGGMVAIQEAR